MVVNNIKLYTALLFVILITACSNDFELTEKWKDLPVVYGLLSKAEEVHYIRVEKAFLDPERSALEIAQIPDSIYYDNIVVQLVNENTTESYDMTRVNAEDEGFIREDGVFATSPNYVYKINDSAIGLVGGQSYRLNILDGVTDALKTTATTTIINDYTLLQPIESTNTLSITDNSDLRLAWSGDNTTAFFSVELIFYYFEQLPGESFVSKSINWEIASDIEGEDVNQLTVDGESFFSFIGGRIATVENAVRSFDKIDVIISAGGAELKQLIDVKKANTGITSSQEIPSFTNLSNGLGIFSSKNEVRRENLGLTFNSLDYLRTSEYTADLNFQ